MRAAGMFLMGAAYTVILQLMLVAAVLYWPDFSENIESLRGMVPIPALQDLLDQVEEAGVFAYVASQHYFKGCNTLGTCAAVLFAVGAVAGEAHRGTLELLLSRPYSRLRILSERWVQGALMLCVPVFLTSLTVPWLADQVDEIIDYQPLVLSSIHQCAFLLTIYSFTFLCSTVGSNPTKIAFLILFLTTFSFALYMVKVMTHYSIYRLVDIPDFVRIDEEGRLDWTVVGPLIAVTGILYGLSVWAFRRRLP